MRQTQIICSIGPASSNKEQIKELVQAGMDYARINFSHANHNEHLEKVQTIREVSPNTPLILDTKGPEIRTGTLKNGILELKNGELINVRIDEDDNKAISLSYKGFLKSALKGDIILIEDGKIELMVESVENDHAKCKIIVGGFLENKKNVCLPNKDINLPAITEKDITDIKFGIKNNFNYIAASFIRCKDDVLQIKEILKEHNSNIKVISKIEHKMAIDNIDEIIEVSDGIMVARGDLGVQVDFERLPILQKMIISKCNKAKIPCIVATQMLDSMIENPRPTRAEVTDVANAVLDGAQVVMLSGETAKGKYPTKSVETMSRIIKYTEMHTTNNNISGKKQAKAY